MTSTAPFEFFCPSCDDHHSAGTPTHAEVARARELLAGDAAAGRCTSRYAADHLRGAVLLELCAAGARVFDVEERVAVLSAPRGRFVVVVD